jgi:hypothetical protein
MKFTDEDLQQLKSVSNVLRGFNHHIEHETLMSLVHRLKMAEKIAELNHDCEPPENELPSILALRGIAPDATGNLKSEDFVRRLRDAER